MAYIKLLLLAFAFSSVSLRLIDLDNHLLEGGNLYDDVYNASMEWGTYKPNQFFGIKNRDPNPVTVGMVWAVPD